MPVLWARDPATGATNALYVNVPNHPDQFHGANQKQFSADFPGYARRKLDATIGGTSVIAAGTLGRQEPPGQIQSYDEVERQGEYVTDAITLALARATPLTSDVLGSTESFTSTTADNAGLTQLMQLNVMGPACYGGKCTIPRAINAPWFDNGSPKKVGTWVSSIRIGSLLYVSNPGESFAEVNEAIRDGVLDAQSVNVVGLAGDFLGYNWVRGQYTDTEFGSSNFKTYNLGPDLAQQTADLNFANARALGFATTAEPVPVVAVKYGDVGNLPGIQFYPTQLAVGGAHGEVLRVEGDAAEPPLRPPERHHLGLRRRQRPDRRRARAGSSTRSPGPGNYQVYATVRNLAGDNPGERTWTETIVIDEPLAVAGRVSWRAGKDTQLHAVVSGGHGKVIAAHWTCPSGEVERGLDVTCKGTDKAGVADVTVVDGAGNVATSEVDISPARIK